MSAIPSGLDLQQSLMRLTDALDALPAAEQARELFALANLVERSKPETERRYGAAVLKAGFTRDETDELVNLFLRCRFQQKALAEWLNRRAREVVELAGLCMTCLGNGCYECQDYAAMARERDAEDRMEVRCAA